MLEFIGRFRHTFFTMARRKTRITARLVALFLACALTLPNPALALRTIQSGQNPKIVEAITAGLEEAQQYEQILSVALPGVQSRKTAREFYRRWKDNVLRPAIKDQLVPKAFREFFAAGTSYEHSGRYLVALMEAVFNAVLHGNGGQLKLFRSRDGALIVQVIDEGTGIENPNELLQASQRAHDLFQSATLLDSGFGFKNMAHSSNRMFIDSKGKRWELEKRSQEEWTIRGFVMTRGSPISQGSVVTLVFDNLRQQSDNPYGAWKKPFEGKIEQIESLPAGLEENSARNLRSAVKEELAGFFSKRTRKPIQVYFDRGARQPWWALVRAAGNDWWIHLHLRKVIDPIKGDIDQGLLIRLQLSGTGQISSFGDILAETEFLRSQRRPDGFISLQGLISKESQERLRQAAWSAIEPVKQDLESAIRRDRYLLFLAEAVAPKSARGIVGLGYRLLDKEDLLKRFSITYKRLDRAVQQPAPPAAGLEEPTEAEWRTIFDALQATRQQFPPQRYGWAPDVRNPQMELRTKMKRVSYEAYTYQNGKPVREDFIKNQPSLHLWVPALQGFDCLNCANGLGIRLESQGFKTRVVNGETDSLWTADFLLEIPRFDLFLSATPGIKAIQGSSAIEIAGLATKVSAKNRQKSSTETISILEERQREGVPIEDSILPMVWYPLTEDKVLLIRAGIDLGTSGIMQSSRIHRLDFILDGTLIQRNQVVSHSTVTIQIPPMKLKELRERLLKEIPTEVLRVAAQTPGITVNFDKGAAWPESLQSQLEQEADLLYHFITKLDPDWVAQHSAAGLEEGKRQSANPVVILGPSALAIPRVREAVEVLREAGLEERLIVLPDAALSPVQLDQRLVELAARSFVIPNPIFIGYASSSDLVMERFQRIVQRAHVSFEQRPLASLQWIVSQILDDLGNPGGVSPELFFEWFVSLAGIEEAA